MVFAAAEWFSPYDAASQSRKQILQPPLGQDPAARAPHWAGTDALGRDVWSRTLAAGRRSVVTAAFATLAALGVAALAGGAAGYWGGWRSALVLGVADVFLALPWFYIVVAARAVLPLELDPLTASFAIGAVLAGVGWARGARLVASAVASARRKEYALIARDLGAPSLYLLRTHVLPQATDVLVGQARVLLPQFVLAEVGLSFIGLGVGEPTPSLGGMLASLRSPLGLQLYWWLWTPAAAVLVLALAVSSLIPEPGGEPVSR